MAADPNEAWQRALACYRAGRLEEAEHGCRRLLAAQPADADALHLLGAIAHARGATAEAIAALENAARAAPERPDIANTLGAAYLAAGRAAEAEDCLRAALALDPRSADAHNNLGIALRGLGRRAEAEASLRQAIALRPQFPEAHNNLGNLLRETGRPKEAEASYRRALRLRPAYAEAHAGLGVALREQGRLEEAARCAERAIALAPRYAEAYNDLGVAFFGLGRLNEAERAYRAALAIDPALAIARANLAYLLNCLPGVRPEEVLAAHREAARALTVEAKAGGGHRNDPDPQRRLRVGYVSADLRRHSVGFFFEPLIECHDRSAVEAFCYYNSPRADEVTERLRRHAAHWCDAYALDDAALAERIRADRIDILVDLSGLSAGNRLAVFARKPAPVQVSWLGYPNTTGLEAIDWRLTDALADPPGRTERFYVEKLVRLPRGFLCYRPPEEAPAVGELPALRSGRLTFGCFNHLPKLTDEMLALWGRLLAALPQARLMLKAFGLSAEGARRRLLERLARHGIGAERVELRGPQPTLAEHLACYGEVDIALDVFPYNGATTTCEALWMGVPVVTLAGATHVARVGASILSHAGLAELVAETPERYVEIALSLARDPGRLAALRAGLRTRLRASAMLDAQGFARQMEDAYRTMWRDWCTLRGKSSALSRVARIARRYFFAY
ncbi:MAG: tetratricopeptide repeat protein [Burkholderiales bacterium]|nr:tetratricopeptide repeat protein [Burkholderiales bacterium]